METTNRLSLRGVRLRSRNFRGEVKDFNERGNRNVLVVLGKDNARDLGFDNLTDMYNVLKADNWNIKRFNVTEDNDDPDCFIPANAVYFEKEKSMIFMKTARGKGRLLTEDSVAILDGAEIENVDVILNKHYYNSHGREGYNTRIKSMEVTIIEDDICARNSYDDNDETEFPYPER